MTKTCLVYRTHQWNSVLEANFNKLKSELDGFIDVYLSFDNFSHPIKPDHYFGVENVRFTQLNSNTAAYNGHVMMTNPELAILDFKNRFPNYERYYLYEYDVFTKGDYREIFSILEEYPQDYLASSLKTEKTDFVKTGYKNMWLEKPRNVPYSTIYMSYHPIVRYSKRLLDSIERDCFGAGYYGFCEILIPTFVFNNNFTTFDILNTGVTDMDKMCMNISNLEIPNTTHLYHSIKRYHV